MKTADEIKPNYAPLYAAALYPELCDIFQKHGYALTVHGSLARDMDLVAVPWSSQLSSHEAVLKEVCETFPVLKMCGVGERKNHGRLAYTISCGFGECAIDLSFTPVSEICRW